MPLYRQQPTSQIKGTTSVLGGLVSLLLQYKQYFPIECIVSCPNCQLHYNQPFLAAKNSLVFHVFLLSTMKGLFLLFGHTNRGTQLLRGMSHQCFKYVTEKSIPAANDATCLIMQSAHIKQLVLGILTKVR